MEIKLFSDYVIVRELEGKSVTDSGLIMPENTRERFGRGVVLSFGPGRFDAHGNHRPLDLKEGDQVIFERSNQASVEDGKLLIHATEIVGSFF